MVSCRLLEFIKNNFLSQMIDSPTRGMKYQNWLLTNASKLIADIRIGSCLGCSDHAMIEFTPRRNMRQIKSKIWKINFRKAKFQLFRKLVNKIPWKSVLNNKGVEQRWQVLKETFFRTQDVGKQKRKARDGRAEPVSAGQTGVQEGNAQAVEAGTGNLGGV